MIAHVHHPGDVNRSIRGLPKLRALLPTSCVQGADILMIIDRNEGANHRGRLPHINKSVTQENPPAHLSDWRRVLGAVGK